MDDMATREEQETTVTFLRGTFTTVYTANPVHLRRLRKDPRATEVAGGEDWGQFTIPEELFDPLKGFKRSRAPMTEEQRKVAAERLRAARENKN